MMRATVALALLLGGFSGFDAASLSGQAAAGWTSLFDGRSLDGWTPIGDANWRLAEGAVQADKGSGFLVSKQSYGDFELRTEVWVDEPANSGVFIRISDPTMVSSTTSYEVNIFDTRPDPVYRTGAIVNIAKPMSVENAANKWNTLVITAKGPRLTVNLNGKPMVDVQDTKHSRGPIALQYGAGVVKFRKVEIR